MQLKERSLSIASEFRNRFSSERSIDQTGPPSFFNNVSTTAIKCFSSSTLIGQDYVKRGPVITDAAPAIPKRAEADCTAEGRTDSTSDRF
jgi:hypothetical protein